MNLSTPYLSKKNLENLLQVKIVSLLCLFLIATCSSLPDRKFPKHSFSTQLITKEFTPEDQKWLPAIVIYEPILLSEKALFRYENNREAGLIPYLNNAGYIVYLISAIAPTEDFTKHAVEFDSILNQIANKHKNRDVILAGLSLGGQAVLEYMTLPSNLDNYARVKKIFFIGTGIDYNYNSSFSEKSVKLEYANHSVKELCKDKKADNFCSRYISFNNKLQNVDNSAKLGFFNRVPKIEKEFVSKFHKTKLRVPYFLVYGKLDSISPEESIYPFFHKIRTSAAGNKENILYEAGEANGHDRDYDHADLFLFKNADNDIYSKLVHWLQEN